MHKSQLPCLILSPLCAESAATATLLKTLEIITFRKSHKSGLVEGHLLGLTRNAPMVYATKPNFLKTFQCRGLGIIGKKNKFEGSPDEISTVRHLFDQLSTPLVRLSSGQTRLDTNTDNVPRYKSRNQAIIATIVALDDRFGAPADNHARQLIDESQFT